MSFKRSTQKNNHLGHKIQIDFNLNYCATYIKWYRHVLFILYGFKQYYFAERS